MKSLRIYIQFLKICHIIPFSEEKKEFAIKGSIFQITRSYVWLFFNLRIRYNVKYVKK